MISTFLDLIKPNQNYFLGKTSSNNKLKSLFKNLSNKTVLKMNNFLIIIFSIILAVNSFEVTNDKYFFSYPFKANWFRAVEACRFKNMDIVSVDNADKLKELHEFVTSTEANISKKTNF